MPKGKLCAFLGYFAGMFLHDFAERVEDRTNFIFDEDVERCSQDDFVKFLHYSIGCRPKSECVMKGDSAEARSSILLLADKYLYTDLIEEFFDRQNPDTVYNLINGDTLKFFLPLCFSAPQIAHYLKSICMFGFLRYSNAFQICETLNYLSGNIQAIQHFKQMLIDFLIPFTEELLQFGPNTASGYWNF